MAQTANSMGIVTPLDGIPAEGIGGLRIGVSPLEMSSAYATLAAGGLHRKPVAVSKVVFPGGQRRPPEALAAASGCVSPAVAWEVTRLLHDNIIEGTGTAAYTGCAGQAGKTGTTDKYTDAWFAGYQPNLATVVWVGYPESNDVSMSSVHGQHRLRRHLPGRDLALALLRRRACPARNSTNRSSRSAGRRSTAATRARAPATTPASAAAATAAKAKTRRRPGSAAVGGYDPERLRAGRRPGTGAAATPAARRQRRRRRRSGG